MYRVYKNGRIKSYTYFESYEKARQFVRKLLRRNPYAYFTPDGSNPIIVASGYEIRRS